MTQYKNTFLTTLMMLCVVSAISQQLTVPNRQIKLPNGLNIILHQDNTIPRATVNVWYHVGSGSEKPGRTGFAHLFEHILFEGSEHVPEGKFDEWLEAAGASNNGSTTNDRTNYYEEMPSNALDLALFLESDRMGFLVSSLTEATVDGQRDVVKNERRQSYENRPYGKSGLIIPELLYDKGHPYSWPVIGSMEDLTAAKLQDVIDFFTLYYAPGNASICVAGDIDLDEAQKKIEKWFSDVKPGKSIERPNPPKAVLLEEKRIVLEDKVQLPQLRMVWLSPAAFLPGDAEMDIVGQLLAGGKNSRLYKKLVYELQLAQNVIAYNSSKKLNSEFYLIATARPGVSLAQLEKVIQQEIDLVKNEVPAQRELDRIVNQLEADFLRELENVGNKADRLNHYYYFTGNPDYFNEDLQRYKAISTSDISTAARQYLTDKRIVMSIVPEGKNELAAEKNNP